MEKGSFLYSSSEYSIQFSYYTCLLGIQKKDVQKYFTTRKIIHQKSPSKLQENKLNENKNCDKRCRTSLVSSTIPFTSTENKIPNHVENISNLHSSKPMIEIHMKFSADKTRMDFIRKYQLLEFTQNCAVDICIVQHIWQKDSAFIPNCLCFFPLHLFGVGNLCAHLI